MNDFPSARRGPPPESRAAVVLAVTAAMIATSSVFVSLRLVSRIGIVKKVTLDDYFIVLAWIFALGLSLSICLATHYGLGLHARDVLEKDMGTLARLQYTFNVLYNPALMATKTSILVFYLKIAKTVKIFKWTAWVVLGIVNAGGIALSLLNILQCRPLTALFKVPRPDSSTCFDIVTLYLSSAPLNIMTDLCILLLPMPVLKSMRLPRKQKIILYITFGFGVFVTAVDVVRISYLQSASQTRLKDIQTGQNSSTASSHNEEESDFPWYASLAFMWSAIEVNVGIMCACVPALKPLVVRFMPRFLSDSRRESVFSKSTRGSRDVTEIAAKEDASPRPLATGPDAQLDMMEFLTTPDMAHTHSNAHHLERTDTVKTEFSAMTPRSTGQFFDFVNMSGHKSLVSLTVKESIRPIVEITVVFFLWGFAYGLLNTLNAEFQLIAHMSTSQTIGIHSAYYAGYFVGPLTFGRLILKKWGFKACIIVGFVIYGTGTLVFWPSAVLTSFPAFLISNFIVGLGLSTLEIAANPFTALCGPPEYAELRLQLSQAFQACGTVVSPLLAKKALFKNVQDPTSLIDVQWTYLAISLFVYILAFVYHVIKMPEVSDDQLEQLACNQSSAATAPRKKSVLWWTLALAVMAQFLYVGAQECVATSTGNYLSQIGSMADGALNDQPSFEAVGHTLFAISRFASAGLSFLIKPRHQLLLWMAGTLVFSVLAMNFHGDTAGTMLLMVYFFEGPLFSLLFAIPLRGLGRHTRDGSALLTSAISGGAVFPPIMHAVAAGRSFTTETVGSELGNAANYQYAFCVVVAVLSFAIIFPLHLNVFVTAKKQVDPAKSDGQPRRYSSSAMTSGIRRIGLGLPKKNKVIFKSEHGGGTVREEQASDDLSTAKRQLWQ